MLKELIRQYARVLGASLVGFASAADFGDAPAGFRPTDIMPGAKGVVVMGKALPLGAIGSGNAVVYTQIHTNTMKQLDTLAHAMALFIEENGGLAIPVPADDPYFHWEADRKHGIGILSHRHAAAKAGLGVIGKNALLITPKYGNRVELVSIVTDVLFTSPSTAVDLCCPPECQLCLAACPVGALDGSCSVEQVKCRSNLAMKSDRGHNLMKCWECRAVCPAQG